MKKITGTLALIGSVGGALFIFYALTTGYSQISMGELLIILTLFFSTIHYTIDTRFWTDTLSKTDSVENENQILKKQIEQKELRNKLSKLENES